MSRTTQLYIMKAGGPKSHKNRKRKRQGEREKRKRLRKKRLRKKNVASPRVSPRCRAVICNRPWRGPLLKLATRNVPNGQARYLRRYMLLEIVEKLASPGGLSSSCSSRRVRRRPLASFIVAGELGLALASW